MSETAATKLPEGAGIIQQTEEERVLARLEQFKVCNLNARQKRAIDYVERNFVLCFMGLSWSVCGVAKEQLAELGSEDLKILARMLEKRTIPMKRLQLAFVFGVPVIGWIIGLMFHDDSCALQSWCYARSWRKLRKVYGKDYFPSECVKRFLT